MAGMHTAAQNRERVKTLKKGLTQKQARALFPWRKAMGDCRAFSYSAATGRAVWT